MDSKECATIAAKAADDKKAEDIKIIEVGKITPLTDYLVICSAESGPQIKAIADNIHDKLKEKGEKGIRIEGNLSSNWLVLDAGNIIVHIMGAFERKHYNLDELWEKGAIIYHL